MHLYEFRNLETYVLRYLNPNFEDIIPLVRETWEEACHRKIVKFDTGDAMRDLNNRIRGISKPFESVYWLWLVQDLLLIANRHEDVPLDLSDLNRLFEPEVSFHFRLPILNPLTFLLQLEAENPDWRLHLKPFGRCSTEVAMKMQVAYPSLFRELNLQG